MSTDEGLSRGGAVLATVAVAALVLAAVSVVAPGAVPLPSAVRELLQALPPGVVLSLLALVALVLLFVRSRRSRATAVEPLLEPAEGPARAPALGHGFDEALAAAVDLEATRERRLVDREGVEAAVRAAVVEAYAVEAGVDADRAREAVETGTWTDDRRASALVGGPDAPSPPWSQWLFDLLRSESAYRRRVRHAIAETERLLLDGTEQSAAATDAADDGAAGADGGVSA